MSLNRSRPIRTVLAGAVLAAGLLGVDATAAHAADLGYDRVKLTGAETDFGRNWDSFGTPLNGGYLYWELNNGEVEADLEGYLYMKNAAGDCAKIQLEYHDDNHHVLAVDESPRFCTQSDRKVQFFINEEESNQFTTHVVIRLLEDNGSDGTYSTVSSGTYDVGH